MLIIAKDALTMTYNGVSYSNFHTEYKIFKDTLIPLLRDKGTESFSRVAIRKINLIGFGVTEDSTVASTHIPLIQLQFQILCFLLLSP